jgi:hypothetical protein
MELNMRVLKRSAFALLIVCASSAASAGQIVRKEIIRQARASDYSLRRSGLVEFQSTIKPNWAKISPDVAANPEALRLLNGIHFSMLLDSTGKVAVSHRVDIAPPNQQAADGLSQIYGGMEQMVSGFFDTWAPFMLTSPFPDVDSEYDVISEGDGYRLSYRDGGANVVTTMSKDLLIIETKVLATDFTSSLKPHFTKSREGLLLSGYEANYQPKSGPGVIHLEVSMNYQEAAGFELPQTLRIKGNYDDSAFDIEITFVDYQVKKR